MRRSLATAALLGVAMTASVCAAPEPTGFTLAGLALAAFVGVRWRRRLLALPAVPVAAGLGA